MLRILILAPVFILLFAGCADSDHSNAEKANRFSLQTNDEFIRNLYTGLDLDDPKAVFAHVFELLPNEVMVFPSENVYYFKFQAMGKTMDGTITLYAHERDTGMLGFGYVNRMEFKSRQNDYPIQGGFHDFVAEDGMILKKVDNYNYTVDYQGKRVLFKLYELPTREPVKMLVGTDEEVVSPTFDESGLQFYLMFHKGANRLFWVLNEDEFVPESFHLIGEHFLMGDRTEFVFFNDSLHNRKVLVAVEGKNVMQNNWYDGPFDHLPDNRVYNGELNMQPFLEAHYPEYKDRINKFGHYKHGARGSRVALAPYIVYFSMDEFVAYDSIANAGLEEGHMLTLLTKQAYTLPQKLLADSR